MSETEMSFSEKHFAEKSFEKWCKENPSGYQVKNCASSVFGWLTDTPEGKEILKKLCQEV